MLAQYSSRLNAVELNNSFYRSPEESTLAGWAAATPDRFRFSLKAHRALTYSAAAFDKVGVAKEFGQRLSALGSKAGPVLLQFPPARTSDPDLLDRLLAALAHPAAVEFRHASWFHDSVYAIVRKHAGAVVVTDAEGWPAAPEVSTGTFAYYRLRREYDTSATREWGEHALKRLGTGEDVYVFFKHTAEGPRRALQLLEAAVRPRASGPP